MVSEAVVKRALAAFDVPHTEKYRMRMMRALTAALPTQEEHTRGIEAAAQIFMDESFGHESDEIDETDRRIAGEIVSAYLAAVGLAP